MRLAAALLLVLAGPATAATLVSPRADKVMVVVYSDGSYPSPDVHRMYGLALVSETRTVDLPAGVSDIQFRNVAATLVPQTVQVAGLDGVSERNFDFNLLTPGALLQKSLGQTVRIRHVNPATGAASEEPATVRSGPDGVMLETARGAEAIGCSGLKEDIIFERLPENLLDVPTLGIRATAPRPGRYTITLHYLATGLTWSASYVARITPGGRTLDLSGWITLGNDSETGFADTPVQVVAGQIETSGNSKPVEPMLRGRSSSCWPTNINWARALTAYERMTAQAQRVELRGFEAPSPSLEIETLQSSVSRVDARDIGDLKLYALAEPTTLAAKQIKQIGFLDSRNVPYRRIYRINAGPEVGEVEPTPRPARLVVQLTNDKASRLGKPLPAGTVMLSEAAGGIPVVAGQAGIRDTPVGLPMELRGNETMAVSAALRAMPVAPALQRPDGDFGRRSYELTVSNNKSVAATFEWRLRAFLGDNDELQKVVAESTPHLDSNGEMIWTLRLKPNSQMRLRYTIDWPR